MSFSSKRSDSPSAIKRADSPAGEKVPGFWGRPSVTSSSRSSSTGSLLSAIGLASPSLRINFAEDLLYLHPAAGSVPTEDPSVEGTVTLYLPKARTLRHLSVKLIGRTDLGWTARPYESFTCLEKEISLFAEDQDTFLEKGEHTFAFSIIVPSSTASYERSQYGRTKHHVVARAKGLGAMGGDLKSEDKPLYLIVNPGGAGDSSPPPPIHYKIEGMDNDLGPYTTSLQSQHIMIGGLLLFRLNLISPPSEIAIFSIKIKINQHFTLRSPPGCDPPYVEHPPSDVRSVALIDLHHPPNFGQVDVSTSGTRSGSQTPRSGPLQILEPDTPYKIHHLVRLPNDNVIRASTQEGTETSINVRHDIAIEITYQPLEEEEEESVSRSRERAKSKGKRKERERKVLLISKPLDIYSCCCWVDSLTLPPYARTDPNPTPDLDAESPCMCGFPIEMILKHHGGTLLHEEGEQGVTYAHLVKDDDEEEARGRRGRLEGE